VAEGTRTPDHRDHNPGLYQLSYRHRGRDSLAGDKVAFRRRVPRVLRPGRSAIIRTVSLLVCWALFPLALGLVCLGCGLLVERARGPLPGALLLSSTARGGPAQKRPL
jgi:hypothetical protein